MLISSSQDQPKNSTKRSLSWMISVLSLFLVIGTIIFGIFSLLILTTLFIVIYGSPPPQVINGVIIMTSLLLGIFLSLRLGTWFISTRSIFFSAQIRQIVLSLVGVFVGIYFLLSVLFWVFGDGFSYSGLLIDLIILIISSVMIYFLGIFWLRKIGENFVAKSRETEFLSEKKRGVWLTLWFILLISGNLQASIILSLNFRMISQVFPEFLSGISMFIIYAISFITFLNIIFLIFLFRWKKWAFYALCGGYFLVFVMMMIVAPLFVLYFGPLATLILGITYLLLRPKWQFLK